MSFENEVLRAVRVALMSVMLEVLLHHLVRDLAAPCIVKYRDASTDASATLEEALR